VRLIKRIPAEISSPM